MKKIILSKILILLFLVGCKSPKNIVSQGTINKGESVLQILEKHQKSFPEFAFLAGNISVSYADGENSQTIPLSFRMEKNKAIWFSAPMGMAKIYITPQQASYYNRLNNSYFDGDFSVISNLLGFEVDFFTLQNLLLGQILYENTSEDFSVSYSKSSTYDLKHKKENPFEQLYEILADSYRVGKLQLSNEDYRATAVYQFQKINEQILPETIEINTADSDRKIRISLKFNGLEFKNELQFPFKIPSGMKPIE